MQTVLVWRDDKYFLLSVEDHHLCSELSLATSIFVFTIFLARSVVSLLFNSRFPRKTPLSCRQVGSHLALFTWYTVSPSSRMKPALVSDNQSPRKRVCLAAESCCLMDDFHLPFAQELARHLSNENVFLEIQFWLRKNNKYQQEGGYWFQLVSLCWFLHTKENTLKIHYSIRTTYN